MKKGLKTTTAPAVTILEMDKTDAKQARSPYRIKRKAGNTDKIPGYLPVITNQSYLNALTLNKNSTTHLHMLPSTSKLEYENNILYLDGKSINYTELNRHLTEDGIEKINFPLLAQLYSIILYKFLENDSKRECRDEEFAVYYPDLAGRFRKSKTKKKKTDEGASKDSKQKEVELANSDWKAESAAVLNDNMALFGRMAGIINAGTPGQVILPLLTGYKYNPEINTIHFRIPYMTKLITEIHKSSIKKDKNDKPILRNGKPQMNPSHSFIVSADIAKERNKKAVEIVLIVVALIERAGNHKPHIRAKNIIERTCLLKHSLEGQNTSNQNLLLKRAFSKAWELLASKTSIKDVYRDIHLPGSEDIPTSSKLDDMVFCFSHSGKNR